MTHLYRMLVGGNVIPGAEAPTVSAVAWAEDMLIALGTDADVLAISRGDSLVSELRGAWVVPLGAAGPRWPASGALEVGGPADLAVVDRDPRPCGIAPLDGETATGAARVLAVIRGGRVVAGDLGVSVSADRAWSDRRPREETAPAG